STRSRQPQEVGEYRYRLGRGISRPRQQVRELVELCRRGILATEFRGSFEPGNKWIERAVAMMRRTEIMQPDRPLGFKLLQQCPGNPGLADAGLAGNEHDLPFALLGPRPAAQQQLDFLIAADQRAERYRTQRRKAVLDRAFSQHLPSRHWPGQPLQCDGP